MSTIFKNYIHGRGIFLAHNHAKLDRLDEAMREDCNGINDSYSFFDFVIDHNGGYISRNEFLCWFHAAWRFIPKAQLYNTYKELLDDMYLLQGHYAYPQFFLPDLLCEIMTLNRHDTVENPELTSLLDEDGYLTVYRGQVAERMRNANSWTLDRSMAIHVGRAYTLSSSSPTFYCVTGKVKLDDVIAFLQGRKEHEVMVMQRNVKHKTKEMLNSEDYELTFPL